MTKFREHRGSLSDSLETLEEVSGRDALVSRAAGIIAGSGLDARDIQIAPYGRDERIGWDSYIVTLDGYGVLGFTDGPITPASQNEDRR